MVTELKEPYIDYPVTKPEGFQPFHESTIAPICYEIPLGSKVLDIGCNDGAFMELIRDKRECTVSGVDPAEGPVKVAQDKGLYVQVARGEHLPFPDASFDVVTLIETLSHLNDISLTLKEIKRVLKPGGFLLGSLPHKNMESYIWSDQRLHKRYFDESQLRDILEQQFPTLYLRVLTGAQFALVWAQSVMGKKPCEFLFKAGDADLSNWESEYKVDSQMRVWFGYTQLAGTTYYRMIGFAEKMDQMGLAEVAYERGTWVNMEEAARRWQQALSVRIICGSHCKEGFHYGNRIVMAQMEQLLRVADVSVWQIVGNRGVLAFLRCAKDLMKGPWYLASGKKKFIVTEIDDYILDIPGYNIASNPYQANSEMEWVAIEQIKLSDALICSTQFLLDKLKMLYPEMPIYLVPNSIDFKVWDNVKPHVDFPKKAKGKIRIGYTGCSNHRQDLEMLKEPLTAILKEFPEVQFLMTPQPEANREDLFLGWPDVPNIGVVTQWVTIDKYPDYLAGWDLDIGIAPLLDNNFNRAKSNLRWLEYSALKIPTIASKVYPFKNSIRDGEDGLICNSSQQWYDALKQLITDQSRRLELGQRAYARVKSDFNMDETAKHYAKILEAIRCNVQT